MLVVSEDGKIFELKCNHCQSTDKVRDESLICPNLPHRRSWLFWEDDGISMKLSVAIVGHKYCQPICYGVTSGHSDLHFCSVRCLLLFLLKRPVRTVRVLYNLLAHRTYIGF